MDIKTEKVIKEICKECKGNGFVRVPYEQAGDEQWADCDICDICRAPAGALQISMG